MAGRPGKMGAGESARERCVGTLICREAQRAAGGFQEQNTLPKDQGSPTHKSRVDTFSCLLLPLSCVGGLVCTYLGCSRPQAGRELSGRWTPGPLSVLPQGSPSLPILAHVALPDAVLGGSPKVPEAQRRPLLGHPSEARASKSTVSTQTEADRQERTPGGRWLGAPRAGIAELSSAPSG